jgi:hypothetical protein
MPSEPTPDIPDLTGRELKVEMDGGFRELKTDMDGRFHEMKTEMDGRFSRAEDGNGSSLP